MATRTNIVIEDEYVETIMNRYGVHTKTDAVDLALRHLAGQPMARRGARDAWSTRDRKRTQRRTATRGRVILADTSAWIEFDRASGSPVDVRMTGLVSAGDERADRHGADGRGTHR